MTNPPRITHPIPLAISVLVVGLSIVGCASVGTGPAAPTLQVRVKPMLTVDGLKFKDLSANGKLDAYEDWRRPIDARVADLVAQMTIEEKAGLMLIQTLNGGCDGALQPDAAAFVNQQQMHRFIIRNVVNATLTRGQAAGSRAGSQLTPQQAALFTNGVQAVIDNTPDAPEYPATDTLYPFGLA